MNSRQSLKPRAFAPTHSTPTAAAPSTTPRARMPGGADTASQLRRNHPQTDQNHHKRGAISKHGPRAGTESAGEPASHDDQAESNEPCVCRRAVGDSVASRAGVPGIRGVGTGGAGRCGAFRQRLQASRRTVVALSAAGRGAAARRALRVARLGGRRTSSGGRVRGGRLFGRATPAAPARRGGISTDAATATGASNPGVLLEAQGDLAGAEAAYRHTARCG